MSIAMRCTARTAPTARAATAAMTVIGWRRAKTIGFSEELMRRPFSRRARRFWFVRQAAFPSRVGPSQRRLTAKAQGTCVRGQNAQRAGATTGADAGVTTGRQVPRYRRHGKSAGRAQVELVGSFL